MDFELRFPKGLESLNRAVSLRDYGVDNAEESHIAMIVTHELEFEHMMEWVAFQRKETERELQRALAREDYEQAVKLMDKYRNGSTPSLLMEDEYGAALKDLTQDAKKEIQVPRGGPKAPEGDAGEEA